MGNGLRCRWLAIAWAEAKFAHHGRLLFIRQWSQQGTIRAGSDAKILAKHAPGYCRALERRGCNGMQTRERHSSRTQEGTTRPLLKRRPDVNSCGLKALSTCPGKWSHMQHIRQKLKVFRQLFPANSCLPSLFLQVSGAQHVEEHMVHEA